MDEIEDIVKVKKHHGRKVKNKSKNDAVKFRFQQHKPAAFRRFYPIHNNCDS